ncbi:VOC family protein [Capilliphycus salinus ALCB114379]|uniref:VOC family protein n=1 Tax=Capilliphycus salinus TaxID=2768948 RepID=UPI0039A71A98
MKLNQVTIGVTDMNKSIQFYQGLGLIQIVATEDLHYSRFLCPDGEATFSLEKVESVTANPTTTIYFECDHLDEKVKQLQAAGYDFESEPTDQSWLWRESYLLDPDGNRICLYSAGENRINPPWRLK